MKSFQIILLLLVLIVSLYFWGQLTGKIYFDPLCKRYGETFGYTYTGFHIRTHRSSPKCYYLDANGHIKHVNKGEIQHQFLDYVRGVVHYVIYIAGVVGAVVIAKMIGEKWDKTKIG